MKPGRSVLLSGVFGLGFGAAWLLKPASSAPVVSASKAGVTPVVTKVRRPDEGKPDKRVGDLLKRLDEAGYDSQKKAEALAGADSADFSRMIAELARRAGFTGLEYADERKMEELVVAWYRHNPDEALGWVLGLGNEKDRQELLGKVIGEAATKDLDLALDLLRTHGRQADGGWHVPYGIFDALSRLDAGEMVRTLGGLIATDGSSTGSEFKFSPDFDFRQALDGLAGIKDGLKGKETLAAVPTNLISEWARRDPAAAWEWVRQMRNVPYNDIDKFFEGYRSVAEPDELADMVVAAMELDEDPDKRFRIAWQALAGDPQPESIASFLDRAPDGRETNLRLLFRSSMSGVGGDYDRFKILLVQQMSAAERTEILTAHSATRKETSSERELLTPALRQLGHTDEEIGRLFTPKL